MNAFTADRAAELPFTDLQGAEPVLSYTVPVNLTSNRERTPQGFLRIRNVVIARTGVMIYGAHEVPVEPGPLGLIEISREPEDVFSPETIASFDGVPITMNHPQDANGMLTPITADNFGQYTKGYIYNIRQGEGTQSNLLLADALIYSSEAIEAIENGKRQVSAGYDAKYIRIEAGRGKQVGIVGNHLAIVDRGRCGSVCSFGDQDIMATPNNTAPGAPNLGATSAPGATAPGPRVPAVPRRRLAMTADAATRLSVARIMQAVRTGDEELVEAELMAALPSDVPPDVVPDPLDLIQASLSTLQTGLEALGARMDALEKAPEQAAAVVEAVEEVAEVAAEVLSDAEDIPDEHVTDAAYRDVISRAEILSPGLTHPTGDTIATPASRKKAMRAHMVAALGKAYDAAPAVMKPVLGAAKPAFDAMPSLAVRALFIAGSEVMKVANRTANPAALPAGFSPNAGMTGDAAPSIAAALGASGPQPGFGAAILGMPAPAPAGQAPAPARPTPASITARNREKWQSGNVGRVPTRQ